MFLGCASATNFLSPPRLAIGGVAEGTVNNYLELIEEAKLITTRMHSVMSPEKRVSAI